MASSYVNDLRLNEMATGDASGTWGETTNTNLELIAEAFSYGTEAITTNADTHTTTIADGATDPGRSMFLKYTGTLDSTCTITIGPNTVSKLWIIENGTSGSQSIIIKQGSGATVTIPSGKTKVIYSDGAGSGGAMVDAFASLNLQTSGIIESSSSIQTPLIEFTDGDDAMTIADGGQVTFAQNIIGTLGTAAQANITSLGTLTGLTVNGDVTLTGSSNNIIFDQSDDSLEFEDNAKAKFGAGDDLQIYHDGSNSRIQEGGTGSLLVRGTNLQLQDSDGYDYVTCTDGGDGGTVALKHLGSTVLSTASGGITVTSAINDLTIAAGNIQTNTSNNLSINTPNSLRINIDSNNDGTSENFIIGHNQTAVDASNNVLLLVQESGKVSIGGTNPNATLQVGEGTTSGDATNPAIQIGRTSSYRFGMYASTEGAVIENKNGDDGIQFRVKTAGEAMRIDGGTGRVGIGTSSPSQLLSLEASDTTVRFMEVKNSAGSMLVGINGSGNAFVSGQTSGKPLIFETNNTERMQIASDGDVGIGTSSPSSKLSVKADQENLIDLQRTTTTTGAAYTKFINDGGNYYIGVDSSAGNRLFASGGAAYALSLTTESARDICLGTNNTERMRIDSSGQVGIGTSSPATWAGNLLQTGTKSLFGQLDTNSAVYVVNNVAYDGSNWKYVTNGTASIYAQDHSDSNAHVWYTVASGTAGNNATLTQQMKLDGSGNLIVNNLFGSTASNPAVKYNATSGLIYYDTSSIRYKENVQDLPNSLEKVKALRPVTFDEKSSGDSCTGLIAEEVVVEIPDLVQLIDVEGYDTPQPNSVDYAKLSVYLLKAMQEQQTIIDDLKTRIEALEG